MKNFVKLLGDKDMAVGELGDETVKPSKPVGLKPLESTPSRVAWSG